MPINYRQVRNLGPKIDLGAIFQGIAGMQGLAAQQRLQQQQIDIAKGAAEQQAAQKATEAATLREGEWRQDPETKRWFGRESGHMEEGPGPVIGRGPKGEEVRGAPIKKWIPGQWKTYNEDFTEAKFGKEEYGDLNSPVGGGAPSLPPGIATPTGQLSGPPLPPGLMNQFNSPTNFMTQPLDGYSSATSGWNAPSEEELYPSVMGGLAPTPSNIISKGGLLEGYLGEVLKKILMPPSYDSYSISRKPFP